MAGEYTEADVAGMESQPPALNTETPVREPSGAVAPVPEAVPAPPPVDDGAITEADVIQMGDQVAKQENDGLRATFKASLQEEPDKRAGVLKLARESGIPPAVAEARYDAFKSSWEASKFDPAEWRKSNPELAKIALEDPHVGRVVMRDEQLSLFTKFMNGYSDFYQRFDEAWEPFGKVLAPGQYTDEAKQARKAQLQALTHQPQKQAMVEDGKSDVLKTMDPLSRGVVTTIARYQETAAQMEIAQAYSQLMSERAANERAQLERAAGVPAAFLPAEHDTYDLEKRIIDLEQKAVTRNYNEGPVGQLATDVAEAVASEVAIAKPALKGGAAGAVVGGVGGAALGGIAGGPAGALAGARKGAVKGAQFGAKAGLALGSYELESGGAYQELLRKKRDDGQPLTEQEARGGAMLYGGLAAIIELWSTEQMLKSMGPLGAKLMGGAGKTALAELLAKDVGVREIAKRVGAAAGKEGAPAVALEGAKELATYVSKGSIAKKVAVEWAKGAASEGVEEFTQQAAQDVIGYATASKSQGSWQTLPHFGDALAGPMLAGEKGAVGGAGMASMGSVVHVTSRIMEQAQAVKNGAFVKQLAKLSSDSPTVAAAPDAVARLVQRETAKQGEPITHLYVDPHAFTRLFQDAKADPAQAAAQLMGPDGPRLLNEAVAQGKKLEVPIGDYLSKWGATEAAAHLADDVATSPGGLTTRQAVAQRAEIDARAKQLAAQYEKDSAPEAKGAEAAYADALEEQLINTQHMKPEAARKQVNLHRAFIRTMSEVFGKPAAELFRDFSVTAQRGTEPSAVPYTGRQHLEQRALTLTPEQRGAESFIDANTGILNDKAFNELPVDPAKPLVAHISVEGIKYLNDSVSHDHGDLLYRAVAKTLHELDPQAAKVGGDFAVHVANQEELDALLAQVNERLPVKGFSVTGAVGADYKAAGAAHGAVKQAAEDAGARAKRGARPLGLQQDAAALQLPEEKAQATVPAPLAQRVAALSPEDYFNETYRDQETGAWTAKGWAAIPRRRHVIAFDLKGLKKANENFGPAVGDALIQTMALKANLSGGEFGDFAHLHGDEYAAQFDDLHSANSFVARLQDEVAKHPVEFLDPETDAATHIPVDFRFGLGRWSYESADKDLNERKRQETKPRDTALDFGEDAARPNDDQRGERAGPEGDQRPAPGSDPLGDGADEEARVAEDEQLASGLDEARALISRMREPERRAQAARWFSYTQDPERHARPDVPVPLKNELATYGVVDPLGFSSDELGRSLEKKLGGEKRFGKEPEELRRQRLMALQYKKSGDMRGRFEQPAAPPPIPTKSQRLDRVVAHHEEQIRSEKVEHAVAVTPDGTVLFKHSSGHAGQVAFNERQAQALIDSGQATFTHNHPGGTTLSAEDLLMAYHANLREMRAVMPDGTVWRVVRPEAGWSKELSPETLRYALMGEQESSVNRARGRMNLAIHEAGGDPAQAEKAKGYSNELWRKFATEERLKSLNAWAKAAGHGWQIERLAARAAEDGARRPTGAEGRASEVQAASGGAPDAGGRAGGTGGPADAGGGGLRASSAGAGEDAGVKRFFAGGEKSPRGYMEMAQAGMQRVFKIALNKEADLSTFLHESGHVFLELFGELAIREDAPQRVRNDYAALVKWLGVGDDGIQTEHHEKFARAFEAYLMEGKSPSAKLAASFERFKLWLKQIYRSVLSLDVELNDEVRGVFDRLLATDQEISEGQSAMGLAPLFRSPEEAGMNPKQWQEYLEAQLKATSTAQRQLELRAMKDKLRENEGWWKEAQAEQRKAALEEYDALPASKAFAFMRTGDFVLLGDNGEETEKGPSGKLDPARVAYALGRQPSEKLSGVLKKGGLEPDAVADLFGYGTAREMLEAMEKHPERAQWAAERAKERMQERHPDVMAEKAKLAAIVSQGLHGEHTARWLIKEIEALQVKARFDPESQRFITRDGQLTDKMPPLDATIQAAHLIAERTTVRRLDAGAALKAERAAAENAAKAAARGNWEQALIYKQQQLLNLYLNKELTAARDMRDRFVELAGKLSDDKARARLGKASPVYRDGIDSILEALGLKDREEGREKDLASIAEVVQRMEEDGSTVLFDQEVVERLVARAGDYRTLEVAELREVDAAVRNIKAAATGVSTSLVDGKRMAKEEVVAQLLKEAEENLPHLGAFTSSESAKDGLQKVGGFFNAFDGMLLKPETMVGWLGGGLKSLWFRAVIKPLQDAKAKEVDLLNKTVKPILEAFTNLPKEVAARMQEKVDGKSLFPGHREDLEPPTRRFELLMLALNAGNESNMQRLTEGRGISEEQVMKAISTLTKEEMDWVQAVWDAAESLWPEASALEERDSGLAPPKIQPKPLETPHGVYPGGYFPAIYDRRVEPVGERQVASSVAALMDPSYTRGSTAKSHLKKRADNFSGVLSLEPGNIPAHLAQVVHDIAFREPLKSVGGLILDAKVQAALKARLGDGRSRQFLAWVKDVGQMRGLEGMQHAGPLVKAIRALRGNTVIAALGFAVPNMIEDLSNIPAAVALTDLKASHLTAALAEFQASPMESARWAHEKSGELRTRRGQLQRELTEKVKKMTAKGVFSRGPLRWMKHHAFALMEASDWATSTPIWMGAYRQALLAETEADNPNAEADAITKADATVRQVYASHNPVDQAGILRDKGVVGAMLMFYSFLNVSYNGFRTIFHELHTAEDGVEMAKRIPRVGGRALGYLLATSVLSEWLRGRGREPDENWAQWFLRKSLAGAMSSLPFGGDLANSIEGSLLKKQTNVRNTSLVSVAAAVGDAVIKLGQEFAENGLDGDDLDKKLYQLIRAVSPALGIPGAAQGLRTGKYLKDVARGDRRPANPGQAISGAIYGEKDAQPATPFRGAAE